MEPTSNHIVDYIMDILRRSDKPVEGETKEKAEERLDAITYNALKTAMGTLAQADIINMEDGALRNEIYESIAVTVNAQAKTYGITVEDVKIKRFDLPQSNENAV